MIYTETIRYIRCDKCGKVLKTNAANNEVTKEAAERAGWLITNKGDYLTERHYCEECADAKKEER